MEEWNAPQWERGETDVLLLYQTQSGNGGGKDGIP